MQLLTNTYSQLAQLISRGSGWVQTNLNCNIYGHGLKLKMATEMLSLGIKDWAVFSQKNNNNNNKVK